MIYLVKNYNNLENLHIFCYCGNKNNFINIVRGYRTYCSYKCCNKILMKQKLIKMKRTNELKYGVDNPWKNKDIIQKMVNNAKNDIDENGLNRYQRASIKGIQTKKNTIDENGLSIYDKSIIKRENTNKLKYGVSNPWGNKDVIEKIKNIRKNDIDENGLNSYQRGIIKSKQTKKEKYDDENYNNKEKTQQTLLNKFNVKAFAQSQKFKNLFKNKNWLNKAMQKSYETKKKNNSFKKSKKEEQVYNYLLQKFDKNDIIRQYKSKLYPFACDFYIKSLDLYIECHFGFTHYNKPFKNSTKDLEEIEKLKKKSEEINFKGRKKYYYKNMIYTWTDLDVRKLNTFKKNKLNYKIFYNIDQFLNWFNKLKN